MNLVSEVVNLAGDFIRLNDLRTKIRVQCHTFPFGAVHVRGVTVLTPIRSLI
jgi:hypothetical protein